MTIRPKTAVWVALMPLCLAACQRIGTVERREDTPSSDQACQPLPSSFDQADLEGTWVAEYGDGLSSDSILLGHNGTYKQIYDDPTTGTHFEGDWLPWSIETRESGYLWLHLEGMHRCDDFLSVCLRQGGGTDSRTIDYCEGLDVRMPTSVILIVTRAPDASGEPGGIILRHTRLAGSEWTYTFRPQAPQGASPSTPTE